MPMAVPSFHAYSTAHQQFVEGLLANTVSHYQDRLVSLVVFGSYARFKNRRDSDLDLLVVLSSIPYKGRLKRQEEFIKHVEVPLAKLESRCFRQHIRTDVSSLILTTNEARAFNPLYLDMVEHHVLVVDKNDFMTTIFTDVRAKMSRWGSRKKVLGNHSYWEIQPGKKWGEVLDYDQ